MQRAVIGEYAEAVKFCAPPFLGTNDGRTVSDFHFVIGVRHENEAMVRLAQVFENYRLIDAHGNHRLLNHTVMNLDFGYVDEQLSLLILEPAYDAEIEDGLPVGSDCRLQADEYGKADQKLSSELANELQGPHRYCLQQAGHTYHFWTDIMR